MRRISVRVCPKASRVLVKEEGGGLKVYLTRPAQDNMANEQLLEVLAAYLGVKKYCLKVVCGQHSRSKVVEVAD